MPWSLATVDRVCRWRPIDVPTQGEQPALAIGRAGVVTSLVREHKFAGSHKGVTVRRQTASWFRASHEVCFSVGLRRLYLYAVWQGPGRVENAFNPVF